MPVLFRSLPLLVILVLVSCSSPSADRHRAEALLPREGGSAAAQSDEAAAFRSVEPPGPAQHPPQPLELAACIAWAVQHNRDFRIAISTMERSRLGVEVQTSVLDAPQLSASASRKFADKDGDAFDNDGNPVTGASRTDTSEATLALTQRLAGFEVSPSVSQKWSEVNSNGTNPYTSTAGLTISRKLLNGTAALEQRKQLTAAEREFLKGVNTLRVRQRGLQAQATRAFLDLQLAEARLQLRERRLEESRAAAQAVREAVDAGLKAQLEATNATIDLNQAELDVLTDQTKVTNARDALLSLLNLPLGTPLQLRPAVLGDAVPDLPPVERDLERVLARHEDLANLDVDLAALLDAERIQHDQLRPQLTGSLAATRSWTGPGPGEADIRSDTVTFTVELAMPLDGWSGERAEWMQQLRGIREKRLGIADKRTGLEAQVRRLRRNLDDLVRQVQLATARVAAEQAKYRATEINWRTGRVDNLELTRARGTAADAEVSLLSARIDLMKAQAERDELLP